MPTVDELVVAMRADGMTETAEQTERVERQFEEATDTVGENADMMGGFATKWKGAMGAIIGGLAVAAGGLLSRVPVIGESMSLLSGIIDGLAFQIDKALRPSMTGFNEDLAETQREVYNANGPLDALKKAFEGIDDAIENTAISTIQGQIESLTGITIPENWLDFGWQVFTMDLDEAIAAAKRSIREFPQDFAKLMSELSPLSEQEARKAMEGVIKSVDMVLSKITDPLSDAWTAVKTWFGNMKETGIRLIKGLWEGVSQWFGKIIQAIKRRMGGVEELLNEDIAGGISLADIGGGIANTFGVDVGGDTGQNNPPSANVTVSNGSQEIYLNGRKVSEGQARYVDDNTTSRGTFR